MTTSARPPRAPPARRQRQRGEESAKAAVLAVRRYRTKPQLYCPTDPFYLDRAPARELEAIARFRLSARGGAPAPREVARVALEIRCADEELRRIPKTPAFRSSSPSFCEGPRERVERYFAAIPPRQRGNLPRPTIGEVIARLREGAEARFAAAREGTAGERCAAP
jgi:hypothetical protein